VRIIGGTIVVVLGLISAVLQIVSFFSERVSSDRFPLGGVLTLFVVSSFVGIIWQEVRYHRRARYAAIIHDLGQIYLDIQTLPGGYTASRREILEGCRHVVNTLAIAMKSVTGKACSVCIKTMVYDKWEALDRPAVVTLCRDDLSVDREKRSISGGVKHWVDQNFDFEQLHRLADTPSPYFLNNFLPAVANYKNTSFKVYGDAPRSRFSLFRDYFWTLPYKSTIVVPISPRPDRHKQPYEIVGYLCVDSPSRFAFREKHDVEVMIGIANCLYELVYRYAQPDAAPPETN
jgi:hypothetical protein